MSQSMEDNLAAGDAPGWMPEEGDLLIGTVLRLSKGWSDYKQGFYPIITVQPDALRSSPIPRTKDDADYVGPIAIHGFQFVLEDKFTALRPAPGEVIGIKVGPKVPTKDGKRTVATYTVQVEGRSEEIWDEIKGPRATTPVISPNAPVSESVGQDEEIPF